MTPNESQYSNHIDLLKSAIVKDVFVTDEAKRTSAMGGESAEWLFDFRAVLLKSDILNAYCEIFYERYKDRYPFQVCGLEIAAVPLVAAIVMKFHEKGKPLNGFFIRKSRKKSGLLKMVEGTVTDAPVVIVDDLVNYGSSIIRQIEILKEARKEVLEVFTILRFRESGYYTNIGRYGIPFVALFELNDFETSLGVVNLKNQDRVAPENPFEERMPWVFKGGQPNLYHVMPKSGPVVSDGMVYFGTGNGDFFALDVASGKTVWKYTVRFGERGKLIHSTPAVHGDTVVFGAYDGNLYALDKWTGKRKWTFMEADWIGSSPCIAEDLELVFSGLEYGLFKKQGGVSGIDLKTGKKVWEFRSEAFTHGSPAYSMKFGVVACGSNDGVLYALDARSGKLLWSFKTEDAIKYAPRFSDEHGVVVVLGLGSTVYTIDTRTGKEVARFRMDFGGYGTPLLLGDKAVCTSLDKHVYCFRFMTGEVVWKFDTLARCFATPEIVGGKIYVGSNNGRLFEIDPEDGKLLGIFYTRERIVNKIAYDPETEIFLVPTFADEIIALKKKE